MEDETHELTAGYALDALDPEERRAYEEHLAGCERCRSDLAALQDVAAALALATAGPEPSSALRERILAGAQDGRRRVVPFRPRARLPRLVAGSAAAAAAAAIGLGAYAVTLDQRLDDARGRLAAEQAALAVVSDPTARSVALRTGRGRLVVAPRGRAVLVVDGTAPAPPGRTYEVWVIRRTARPAPAGLFGGGGRSVVAITRPVAPGDVVAVTVEHAGGVDAPTSAAVAVSRPV